jgi:uncharacterized membrane protein YhaH (DUF805 family)
MNWYLKAMSNYLSITGRARRMEYWMLFLGYLVLIMVAAVIDSVIGTGIFAGIVALIHLIPLITAGVRRLHDINRNGWWMLIGLVPLIGGLILLYWAIKGGDTGSNDFGPDPITAPA